MLVVRPIGASSERFILAVFLGRYSKLVLHELIPILVEMIFQQSVFFVILNTYLQKQSMISIKIFILLNSKYSVNILSYQRKEGKMQMKPKKEELFFIYFLAICTLDCCNLSMTQCLFSALVKNPNPNLKLLNPFSIFFCLRIRNFPSGILFLFLL